MRAPSAALPSGQGASATGMLTLMGSSSVVCKLRRAPSATARTLSMLTFE